MRVDLVHGFIYIITYISNCLSFFFFNSIHFCTTNIHLERNEKKNIKDLRLGSGYPRNERKNTNKRNPKAKNKKTKEKIKYHGACHLIPSNSW